MAAHAITAVVFVAAGVLVTRDVVVDGFLDWANRRFAAVDTTTAAGVVAPTTPAVSGSPASLAPWATLGEYGRSFVAGSTTPAELRAFHGPEADVLEPIRVYAGLRSAGSADERAALAVRELERTGAFQREVLAVVTTTGTGWVDPDAASAIEYLHAGDTALVGLQYSYLPSWISFLVDRDEAAEAGTALYRHVHRRWSQLPAGSRPKLIIFGESLGSFGAEAAFRGGDAAASLGNLVAGSDGALFTGPTATNHIWDQLTDDREPGSPVWRPVFGGGTAVQFANRPADLERPDPSWRQPRVLYVHHPSDPVGNATLEALWRRPEWTEDPKGYDIPARAGWVPIVTGLQEVFDLIAGFSAPSGYGHNYAVDFADRLGGRRAPRGMDDGRHHPAPAAPSIRVGPRSAARGGAGLRRRQTGLRVSARADPAAMASTTCSASRPTPWIMAEEAAYRKCRPTKYRPGWPSTTPRRCTGAPCSPTPGRSIQEKPGSNPVHQMTLATSRTRPSSSSGSPSRTPATRATGRTPAAARSRDLTRTRGRPLAGELGTLPAADRRVGGQHPEEHHPEDQPDEQQPGRGALDPERDLADVPSRQPGPVRGRELERDLRPRVAGPHDQDVAVPQLGRVAVLGGVELDDAGVELGGEGGHPGALVVGHRHHHVVGLPAPLAGRHHQPAVPPRQPVHPDPGLDRQPEPVRVGLQVVGHLVLGRERPGRTRERHPGQPAVAGRGEQPQRVPAVAPGVPDPLVGVEDHEGPAPPGQVVADREPGLAASDDHRLDLLWLTLWHRLPPAGRAPAARNATSGRRCGRSGVLPTP